MDDTPKPYVIVPGDTLLRIALLHGVPPSEIWDHEKNSAMKARRDPEMLAPGEVLFLPKPKPSSLQVTPRTTQAFSAKVPKAKVYLAFEGATGPLAGEAYEAHGLAQEPIKGSLDGGGKVSFDVPITLERFTLVFPKRHVSHEVWPGFLAPTDTPPGRRQRLLARGHLPIGHDAVDPFVYPTVDTERAALRGFQRAMGLEETGSPDTPTEKKLRDLHGS